MTMTKILAKQISYSTSKRTHDDVLYIVIHNTGNKGDTAVNNGRYFATSNTRQAGAHFFIDRKGEIVKSIDLNRIAWAVGGSKYSDCQQTGGGKYYGKCTNKNSVSIELCDIVDKYPSDAQIAATRECIAYIQKHCKNAKTIIRHFDVTGKKCPVYFTKDSKWKKLKKDLKNA